jgi:excisionase family DNA binding protein
MSLLTIDQLSGELGVSVSTLYKWVQAGKIPFIKLPNSSLRFDQQKIDTWLKHRSVSTNFAGVKI